MKYLNLMRVHHYIKNGLIFAALACSGMFFDWSRLLTVTIGFISFCALSSVVYIINDIQDKDKDAKHPTKCKRPIASGAVSIGQARVLAGILLVVAVVCNCFVFKPIAAVLAGAYLLMNLLYSFKLKNVPLIDVCILVSGFLIRVVYGAVIADINVSNWLYLTVIAISFYLALGKRRNELNRVQNGSTRAVLKAYSREFLDKNMYMCLSLANVFYALWSVSESTAVHYNNRYLIFTVPLVLLITMKYSMNIEGDSEGDPVDVLLHDKVLLFLCVAYFSIMFVILYIL